LWCALVLGSKASMLVLVLGGGFFGLHIGLHRQHGGGDIIREADFSTDL
jgi:hypothetical protein